MVRVIVLGLLLSLSAGCTSSTAAPGTVSPLDSTLAVSSAPAITQIPGTAVPEEGITPTFFESSVVATESAEKVSETAMPDTKSLTITIVYDNNAYDERLKSAWGFSALVEYCDHKLLFDTGGDGPTLVENMRLLEIDPTQIESVVLSHAHGDHTGGLSAMLELGTHPRVYLPGSFPAAFKNQVSRITEVIEVTPGLSMAEGMFTTGEMGGSIPEQALVIQSDQGLVIVTGCAHPGIVEIVEQAKVLFDGEVRLVLGGFHLGGKSKAEIDAILTNFRRLEVERVAPCHCTGDQAIAMFAAEYGEDYIQAGVGRVIKFASTDPK